MEIPITNLKKGQIAIIRKLAGGQHFQSKIRTMGIREGKSISVVATQPFGGPMILDLNGRQITIGRGMCGRIFVEAAE